MKSSYRQLIQQFLTQRLNLVLVVKALTAAIASAGALLHTAKTLQRSALPHIQSNHGLSIK